VFEPVDITSMNFDGSVNDPPIGLPGATMAVAGGER
jgi:hypothetical protein